MQTSFLWRIEMLGTLRASRDEAETITRFSTQKTAALLAYLSYHPARRHSREELIDLLWPDADMEAGRLRLRVALNALRRRLEPPALAPCSVVYADARWIGLQAGAVTTDTADFLRLLDQAAQESDPARKMAGLTQAIGLYRGELLPGFYDEWVEAARKHLGERFLSALYTLALTCETRGECERASQYAQRVLAADPLWEAAHLLLMRLYARSGQVPAALRQFGELQAALKTVEAIPSCSAVALYERIRSGNYAPVQTAAPPAADFSPSSISPPPAAPAPAVDSPNAPSAEPPRSPRIVRLPASLTRFYGRVEEITRLAALLTEGGVRLVTLTGVGGTGKTRLSLEVGRRLADSFAVVCFVPLADVADTTRIPDAVAQSLCLSRQSETTPLEQVTAWLDARPALLILDNLEQLLPEGADIVRDLLERSSHLTILATSRQPLALSGEHESPVPPLAGPLASNLSPVEALRFPGVALYVDRAQTANPGFQITARSAPAIIALCRRLDGIPLAIELAASWAGTLTPAQMMARMTNRFDLLVSRKRDVPARHQTLRAAIHWSYDRLEPGLRRFFAQLSVFRGGWTLEAAEAVCLEPEAPQYLRLLRERAMVVAEDNSLAIQALSGEDGVRYRLLETLREFAQEQLQEHSDGAANLSLSLRHARWFLARLEQGDYTLAEQENYRAAHEWARLQPEQEKLYMQFLTELTRFWRVQGWWREGRAALEAGLERDSSAYPNLYGQVCRGVALMSVLLEDFAAARHYGEQALALFARCDDTIATMHVLNMLGCAAINTHSPDVAQNYFLRSLQLAEQQQQDRGMTATLYGNLGYIAMQQKDWSTARRHMQQCLFSHRENNLSEAWPLQNLGALAQAQEQSREACALFEQSLALYRQLGETFRIAEVLNLLAEALQHCGEPEAAHRCRAESQTLFIQLRGV